MKNMLVRYNVISKIYHIMYENVNSNSYNNGYNMGSNSSNDSNSNSNRYTSIKHRNINNTEVNHKIDNIK